MNILKGFDLILYVVFSDIPQLGIIGSKAQDLVVSFHIVEVKSLPEFHL